MQSQPGPSDIRQFMLATFDNEELDTLCFDYFPHAPDEFPDHASLSEKVRSLILYCQRRGLTDNLLVALQQARPEQYEQQFRPAGPAPVPLVLPRPVRDPNQVFISYAHQDAEFAQTLAFDLQNAGWRVWIAPDSIRPGEKWAAAIERGLGGSGVFLVILTPAAIESRWVTDETNAAIGLEKRGLVRLVPLMVKPCDMPVLWDIYQYVSFREDYAQGLKKLIRVLAAEQSPAPALAPTDTERPSAIKPPVAPEPLAPQQPATAQVVMPESSTELPRQPEPVAGVHTISSEPSTSTASIQAQPQWQWTRRGVDGAIRGGVYGALGNAIWAALVLGSGLYMIIAGLIGILAGALIGLITSSVKMSWLMAAVTGAIAGIVQIIIYLTLNSGFQPVELVLLILLEAAVGILVFNTTRAVRGQ